MTGLSKINYYLNGLLVDSETSGTLSPFIDAGSLTIGSTALYSGFTGFL